MMKKLLFVLITFLVMIALVRAIMGVNQPISTIEIIDYLGKMPVTESTLTTILDELSDVAEGLTKIEDNIREWKLEKDSAVTNVLGDVAVGAVTLANLFFVVQTVGLSVIPILCSAIADGIYFLKVCYYMFYGVPL